MKSIRNFCIVLMALVFSTSSLFAQKTTIGGHVKFHFTDYAEGKIGAKAWTFEELEYEGKRSMGMGFNKLILYIRSQISKKISMDLQPYIDAQTGATPHLDGITGATASVSENYWDKPKGKVNPKFMGFRKAAIIVSLPQKFKLTAGIIKPRFTWDYGAELFWQDEYHGGQFSNNLFLGAIHGTGIEIYKEFDIAAISTHAYLYMLNKDINDSSDYFDNNASSSGMIHIEPEIGPLKLQVSCLYGNHDANDHKKIHRYSGGVAYNWRHPDKKWINIGFRCEAAYGKWDDIVYVNQYENKDAITNGRYGKIFYRICPKLRFMYHYDFVDKNFDGSDFFDGSHFQGYGEEFITSTASLQLNVTEKSVIQIQIDKADWKMKALDEFHADRFQLTFNRFVIGWRTTF